jgi:hypothetical protein
MNQRRFVSIASALGVTTLCCVWIVGPLVSPAHFTAYHWTGPASTLFIPAFLNFIAVWTIVTILLLAAHGSDRRSLAIWAGIVILLPWAVLKNWSLLTELYFPHWLSRSLLGLSVAAFLLLMARWRPTHQPIFERAQRLAVSVLCSIAVCGALILIELVWFGWQARSLNAPLPLHRRTNSSQTLQLTHPRIIWIVLDELSYQQIYGKRFQGLRLPEFDSLATQATVFTHTIPAGNRTEIVMPSLMSGLAIDKIRPLADGRHLMIHLPVEKKWENFDQRATVFQDALDAGYGTAVAGWYNPYCRILPDVLDQCTWILNGLATNRSMPQASILRNTFQPILTSFILMDRLHTALTHEPKATDLYATLHIADYQALSASADRLLEDRSADFILLHMPVPHPGGIYNRTTRSFTVGDSSYIDNLALADFYLEHLRSVLESRGEWDSSVIVIMGDHSWRTTSWSIAPDWKPEEQAASNGATFDDRPAYIVKAPYQKKGARIDLPFDAVDTRLLLDAFIKQQIVSAETLSKWVEDLDKKHPK